MISTTRPHDGDLPAMTEGVIRDREGIAAGLQDIIVRRASAAGLNLESAYGLCADQEVRRRIEPAIHELDEMIREIRTVVFQDPW
jgi:hypothetical protein